MPGSASVRPDVLQSHYLSPALDLPTHCFASPMKFETPIRLVLLHVLQATLLALLLSNWWVHRNNHLFSNSNWIVGKDQGKFVFYTYEWMFRPINNGIIDLGQDQGFQELLFYQPENDQTQLTSLECRAAMSDGTYLWFQFQKKDLALLGIRMSRTTRYPSGFFEFDPHGNLISHTPFPSNPVTESSEWFNVRIEREDDTYRLYINEQLRGSHIYRGAGGHFGFRGSGRARSPVLIRDVDMTFMNPSQPTRTWKISEDFKPDLANRRVLSAAVAMAVLYSLLRLLRTAALTSLLPKEKRRAFIHCDGLGFAILLAGNLAFFNTSSGLHIPLTVLTGELLGLIVLARLQNRDHTPTFSKPVLIGLAVGLAGLSGYAGLKQGELLGRATRIVWNRMQNVDPNAMVLIPGDKPSTSYALDSSRELIPGDPLFVPDRAYQEQEIFVEFTPRGEVTLDLIYQQQGFYTRGDVGGEELALQRRLLRLSTVPNTPGGLSLGVHKQPAPFVHVEGDLHPNQLNTVRLRATGKGVEIELNGTTSFLPGIELLGYGETGLMAYEPSVTVSRFEVSPLQSHSGITLSLKGPSLPVLAVTFLILLLFLRVTTTYTGLNRVGFALLALYPLSLYFTGAVLLNPLSWGFLGTVRFVWLDIGLLTASLALLFPLAGFRKQLKSPPLYFNIVFLLVLVASLLLTWDLLPAQNPLKYKFAKSTAVAPGEIISDNQIGSGPWYSNNRAIGASTYVWRQRFGPKKISLEKDPGIVRVFTIGGSQAWGSGAADSFSTYDALLEKRLQNKGYPVDIYNAGVNGAGISRAEIYFDQILLQFNPDIVIADIGLNDSAGLIQLRNSESQKKHRELLFNSLRAILETCERNNIQFILCLEAMSHEAPLRADKELYDGYIEIANEFGVPVIDSRQIINQVEATSMVWWDTAHYAPYGHHLLADILDPALTKAVDHVVSEMLHASE